MLIVNAIKARTFFKILQIFLKMRFIWLKNPLKASANITSGCGLGKITAFCIASATSVSKPASMSSMPLTVNKTCRYA